MKFSAVFHGRSTVFLDNPRVSGISKKCNPVELEETHMILQKRSGDKIRRFALALSVMLLLGPMAIAISASSPLPEGFVYAGRVIPGLVVELRYFGNNNFIGEKIAGYTADVCIVHGDAAKALAKVQAELKPFGLGIKIFDAYRPQAAVDHFVQWAEDRSDIRMKERFYPDVDKKDLFTDGYIAAKSSHSRGSTVDLTLISLSPDPSGGLSSTHQELDMGSLFDFFGPVSWPLSQAVTPEQRANRMLLQTLMVKHGFTPYEQEWWHFTLGNEPFPDTYFNFPVE